MSTDRQLNELGFYALAGHTRSPRDVVQEIPAAEALGLGVGFLSERYNYKEAGAIVGAMGAVSETLGLATAATNHNTRHPLLTASLATTLHTMTGGRFALGLGRGVDLRFQAIGLKKVTSAQIEDFAGLMRRLWKGEAILGHDGPAGSYPYLHQESYFDFDIPIILVAIGPKTLELAGRVADGVVLHTYFSDRALETALDAIARGAKSAGRDPASIRVWSVLGTIGDHLPADVRLKKTVGRLATYLQGYGDALITINDWDPGVLARFRADEMVRSFLGAIDDRASTEQLEHLATLIPDEWLAAAATGTPEQCAAEVARQFSLGVSGVILHGASPDELAPIVDAYRDVRPAGVRNYPANPGWVA
ncbi:TIGR03857 family LLM class F420-dependent oxidoreductase [Cryptosporangium aurantiacum]|uniref:Probable F420-dependent oxidoreductase, MSMEG_2249 family n=1 Tax=Cryptosporangium aurantiacum TaxID=134849 RepID=A0A1M7RK65_9ACTN|nr:TIGR03857 family LLM class F420-dependent oxidoreductase [Cryptosporangium aurantiacum]SHN46530.1 probable F420-dependent oxidoreductase, MSMEG_2249 family [Cryptosporangium aurantiacum]